MGDWLDDVWSNVSGAASDIWSGVGGAASDIWGGLFGDEGGGFELPEFSLSDIPGFGGGVETPQAGPADVVLGDDHMSNGNGYGMQQVGFPAVAAAGGIWLGSLLTRALGRGAAGAVFTAANGVRVRMAQLWPLVRKYGSQAVAGGLGISAGALGTLLAESAQYRSTGGRGRGRGISARDVKTTRRTLKSIKKLYSMMPTRPSSRSWGGGGHYHYRPRGRR